MEFTVIDGIDDIQFREMVTNAVAGRRELDFTNKKIIQTYGGDPFRIAILSRNNYIKVMTSLENGWPFLDFIIRSNKITAMKIRYVADAVSEFHRYEMGLLIRMQYALKDSRWIWYGKGEIQKWENPKHYTNRVIKNRLTAAILNEYLTMCGYNEILA